jgi:hypothetical protein
LAKNTHPVTLVRNQLGFREQEKRMKSGGMRGSHDVLGRGAQKKKPASIIRCSRAPIDWSRDQILTMRDIPEIRIVSISCDYQGFGGSGESK